MQTALSLFHTGKKAHEQGDTDSALKNYSQAYRIAKELGAVVPGLLDYFAELCVSIGDYHQAKTLLREAIRVEPGGSPQKYLSLAQLESGASAVRLYHTGIRILEGALAQVPTHSDERQSVTASIASAHAAVAELYMTDLCDEEDAEARCEQESAAAIEADPESVEGYQARANLRLVRGRLSEAKDALDKVLSLLQNLGESTLPCPQFLAETARMYTELEAWDCVQAVTDIGIHISEQPDLLYLSAFAKYKLGKTEDCKDVLEVLREVLQQEPNPEIEEAVSELESTVEASMQID